MSNLIKDYGYRFQRQSILNGFGPEAQAKLQSTSVLVIGAGGLGCPALQYLAASGVGTLGIVDNDLVSVTNLHRQILFSEEQVGMRKTDAARDRIRAINSLVDVKCFSFKLDSSNTLDVINEFDVVLDATDNFPTKYLINDACVLADKPLVYGAVLGFEGQVSVFNLKISSGYSSNYRDAFPTPPAPNTVKDCAEAGVLNVVAGIIGCLQAHEVMKIVTGFASPVADKLLIFDGISMTQTTIGLVNHNARDNIRSLIDYQDFCGINQFKNKYLEAKEQVMKEVTVQELQKMKASGADFQLIDVREPYEYDICNLEGELIPMSDIPNNVEKISKDKKVVMHCRSGKRSGDMLLWLEKNHGFENLYNLKGGILAWAKEIDPEMPTY
ncbi:MAG TPA: ThiF family adenylyltransferase [Chryseosolibacter sp.]|nr:ThiF family adenylyltransferase [Chryseosolibacter sp.]